ncbi:MAG: peptide transport permease [Blastococcus sp.]|jgi:peptide/nickel transport system permease protein|nr:peptide transport permease [Blastococcus sp.]
MTSIIPASAHGAPGGGAAVAPRVRGGAPWSAFLLRRLGGVAVLVAVLVLMTFLIVRLVPGDPARNLVGLTASTEQLQAVRSQLGLEDSLGQQLVNYVGNLVSGGLGDSFVTSQPVSRLLGERLPVTAELAGLALAIVIVVGFPAGMGMAAWQHKRRVRWGDSAFTTVTSLGGAMPEYVTGTVLIYLFALKFDLLPAQGGAAPSEIILPALSVAFAPMAIFARLVRNETSAVLGKEYITTAVSKRLPSWRLYLTHVLPNVVTSTLTLGGLLLVALLGGTVITENVFNVPGIGTAVVNAILQSDYPVIQGIILVLGLLAIAITFAVDIVLGLVDPRTVSAVRSQ